MNKLCIIGPYPPPLGGISVHVERLAELCRSFCDVRVIDLYGPSNADAPSFVERLGPLGIKAMVRLVRAISSVRDSVVHIHISGGVRFFPVSWLIFSALDDSNAVVISIHSGSFPEKLKAAGLVTKALIGRSLKGAERIIAVSSQIESVIVRLGIPPDKVSVIPAFIPGLQRNPEREPGSEKYRIVSSGSGIPLYGLHEIVSAVATNSVLRSKCRITFFIYNKWDARYLSEVQEASKGFELEIYFDKSPAEFMRAMGASDLYIRATSKDGDSVAVREALDIGIDVICSDVCDRPPGCMVYPKGDEKDLTSKILQSMRNAKHRMEPSGVERQDTTSAYKENYRSVYLTAMNYRR